MARKIDGISYPDNVLDVLRSRAIGPAFRAFVKSRQADENIDFLDDSTKLSPQEHFKLYFTENGAKSINITAPIREKANKLAKSLLWTNKAGWHDVYGTARREVIQLVQMNFLDEFFRTDYFLAQHEQNLMKKTKVPANLLKDIGVKNANELSEVITMFRSNKDNAIKAADKLAKNRGSRVDGKEIVEELVKSNK
ncbi:hypothetical protein [Parasulfitobacter algicola]|uniref:RGS domain-containing protein n=1 Tax=Parasulfitobacter algicola TaxID=2614809 RepID=A0ABX2IU37_9RHOB|nr:hypothetical protein [Sulfitobacter algicola]NSX53698.1 hypothetical protein [Sulfitobacter algicola]